jgi:hypothetical protein
MWEEFIQKLAVLTQSVGICLEKMFWNMLDWRGHLEEPEMDFMPNMSDAYSGKTLFADKSKIDLLPKEPVDYQPEDPYFISYPDWREQVQQRAYYKWLAAGRPRGQDLRFWAEAEKEVEAEWERPLTEC